jgi:hypothetical protein
MQNVLSGMCEKLPALTTSKTTNDLHLYTPKDSNGRARSRMREVQDDDSPASKPAFWNYAKPLRDGVPGPSETSE